MSLKCNRCTKESKCHYRQAMQDAQNSVDEINSRLQFDGIDEDQLHVATICHHYTPISLEDFEKKLSDMLS